MTEFEKNYIQVARSLAAHLKSYAKDRRDEDKKAIAVSQMELCKIHTAEQREQQR